MIYKYSLSVSGDRFYPERILTNIQGDFIADSYFNPTDQKFENEPDEYGYSSLIFLHKNKCSTEDEIRKYEEDFIEFIKDNHILFIENGATEIEIFIEIYYDGGQCNFEIFNRELLKQIGDFEVALPVSIYPLTKEEIQQWKSEISWSWQV